MPKPTGILPVLWWTIKDVVKDSFTTADGISWDLGRILWFQGTLVFYGLSIWALSTGQAFNPVEWGTGFGLVLAGGGAALAFKHGTEPKEILSAVAPDTAQLA